MAGRRAITLSLAALATGLVWAGGALAGTIVVHPGESIQAAVDAAEPGDTIQVLPGTYHETVFVPKNRITIEGEDATLMPPAEPNERCLGGASIGFCVVGEVDPDTFEVLRYVKRVTIRGFRITGFDDGIFAFGARNASFVSNEAVDNEEYGIFANNSIGTDIAFNLAEGSHEAGIYVGDSPKADAVVINNTSRDNLFGVFWRNALHGSVYGNTLEENCVGLLVLADAPGPSGFLDVSGNWIRDNDKACPETDEGPPLSGVGALLWGATNVSLHDNHILSNNATGSTFVSGGVVVILGFAGTPPTDNLVADNEILENDIDIVWDETGSGNVFTDNICDTSSPPGLCT